MGKVIAQASMSLDGFIAATNDQVGPLFDWYDNGDVEVTGSDPTYRDVGAALTWLEEAFGFEGQVLDEAGAVVRFRSGITLITYGQPAAPAASSGTGGVTL